MMEFQTAKASTEGEKIAISGKGLKVPDRPILPFVEGDGTGPDIWKASLRVLEAAVQKAYRGRRAIQWMEVLAGEKAYKKFGSWLPDETVAAFREFLVGIIGPLTTPTEGGIRSLHVALRKALDLYACQRPVRYFDGLPSPLKHPELMDMVVFREGTEDIYAGIEFENGTEENRRFRKLLEVYYPREFAKIRFPDSAGFGIKPISREGTTRLVRAALQWALAHKRRSVTLVHKGNIMKFTEGAFRNWGYEVAETEFGDRTYTWAQWERTKQAKGEQAANAEQEAALQSGMLLVKDVIADIVFQQTITRPREFDVLATTNLNGDYLSDALSAQVGGTGVVAGGNINYVTGHAIFEARHGVAPDQADMDMANPGSMILSGEMLLRYLGWDEAADRVIKGLQGAIAARTVTNDLHRLMPESTLLKTSEFGDAVIQAMD